LDLPKRLALKPVSAFAAVQLFSLSAFALLISAFQYFSVSAFCLRLSVLS
jgi:hypothetical protein